MIPGTQIASLLVGTFDKYWLFVFLASLLFGNATAVYIDRQTEVQMTTAASSQHQEQFFTGTFSSFSVNDIGAAKKFYGETLGVNVSETNEGLRLDFAGGSSVFIYPKDDHAAATFTVLNFKVTDIEKSVSRLKDAGVEFESYDGEIQTDADNIFRGAENGNGPNIAWFKDPAGNFLSIIES